VLLENLTIVTTAKVVIHQSMRVNVERDEGEGAVEVGAEEVPIDRICDEIRAEGAEGEDVAGAIVGVAVNAMETKAKHDQQHSLTSHIFQRRLDHSPPPPSP
jgi:hypothetical protein